MLSASYVVTFKGIGRIYGQVYTDSHSSVADAKRYEEKPALTRADLLNDWVQAQEVPILRMLTDRGSEYKGRVENHAYELYLAVEGVSHTTTKGYSQQNNGMCERFNKPMKQAFFEVAMRKKL